MSIVTFGSSPVDIMIELCVLGFVVAIAATVFIH